MAGLPSDGPTGRLPGLVPDEMDADQRLVYDAVLGGPRSRAALVNEDGSLRGPFDAMLRSPSIGLPLQAVGAAIRFDSELAPDLRELAILCTSVAWKCEFEWTVHFPIAVAAGVASGELDALRAGDPEPFSDERHQLVARTARALLDERSLSPSAYQELTETLGVRQAFELVATLGYYATLAMILTTYAITR